MGTGAYSKAGGGAIRCFTLLFAVLLRCGVLCAVQDI